MDDGLGVRETRLSNYPRRWNGAPSQELLVIRENHNTGECSLDLLKWGLIPYWCADPKGGRKPINAKSEMAIWPISTRVNSPSNDDEHLPMKLCSRRSRALAPSKSQRL